MPTAHTFATWTAPTDPFEVIDLSTEEGWDRLRIEYS